MAWGYEKCFTIEHDNTLKRRIDCKDYIYYEWSDKSCMKRPLYLPVDGYNSWRKCKYFELDQGTSHYEEKWAQYIKSVSYRERKQNQKIVTESKKETNIEKKKEVKEHDEFIRAKIQERRLKNEFKFCIVEKFPKGKNIDTELVPIIKSGGTGKKIMVGKDLNEKKIYISNKAYTREAIDIVYKILNKRDR